ncbi:ATP-binding protein [Streptomyces sp. NPDC127084]|uniref:sensor histidine kinase n=1 Tax=Streptomyces sp. NPDC127084 TaxID=3347133 RepID=UPI003667E84D
MSQLRAPAARPDRREGGGRHGRSGSRTPAAGPRAPRTPATGRQRSAPAAPPESRIRPQLLRTAVLPAVVASLSGAAAVLFTIRATAPRPSVALWLALLGSSALALAAVAAAVFSANRTARSVAHRCDKLRRSTARDHAELRTVLEGLRRGERPGPRRDIPVPDADADEFDLLAHDLNRSHDAAVAAVVQASRLAGTGSDQKVEVFVNLARRLQSLVHREIQLLDELENEVEDPELLKGLFHVDHLATRIRRHAENLAVLGGAISRRQWSNPVTMTEVLRSSIAEVEQYPRVKLVPPIDGTLRGHAVADVIHLLAELVENATLFSAPHTQVLLRASHVTAGLAVEVEDRGLGMSGEEQHRMNSLLADPDQANVATMLQDGRIGLFVVSALARRHGIAVRLQSNIYGGIQAVLVLPKGLLGEESEATGPIAGQAPVHTPDQTGPNAVVAPPAHHARVAMSAPTPAPTPAPAFVPAPTPPPTTAPTGGSQRSLTYVTTGPGIPHQPPQRPAQAPQTPQQPGASAHGPLPATAATGPRPTLPKRRAQEHLAPQLRHDPVPRPAEEQAIHDPGLMAAFQRGIGLAQNQSPPTAPHEPHLRDDTHKE